MRTVDMLCTLTILALMIPAARQDHAADDHGAAVMGFDQSRTSHHFSVFRDGGAIDVSVNDSADARNRDAIRSHLPHIAMMFGQGRFDAPMLVHDSNNVPGIHVMAKLK